MANLGSRCPIALILGHAGLCTGTLSQPSCDTGGLHLPGLSSAPGTTRWTTLLTAAGHRAAARDIQHKSEAPHVLGSNQPGPCPNRRNNASARALVASDCRAQVDTSARRIRVVAIMCGSALRPLVFTTCLFTWKGGRRSRCPRARKLVVNPTDANAFICNRPQEAGEMSTCLVALQEDAGLQH